MGRLALARKDIDRATAGIGSRLPFSIERCLILDKGVKLDGRILANTVCP
jgi:hypothetical protein